MATNTRKRLWLALRLLVSVGLLAWLVWQYNWYLTWQALLHASVWGITALIGGILINRLIAFYRFWVLLRSEGADIGLQVAARLGFLSAFVTNFLPSTVGGDVVKIGWLGSQGYAIWRATLWTLFDRLSNMTAVGLMIPFCLAIPAVATQVDDRLGWKVSPGMIFYLSLGLGAVCAVILGSGWLHLKKPVETDAPRLDDEPLTAETPQDVDVNEQAEAMIKGGVLYRLQAVWMKVLGRRGIFGLLVIISLLSILPNLIGTWILARDLDIPVTLIEVTAVYVVQYFVTLLPISLNGLGLLEVGTAVLYQDLGATQAQALAMAVLLRFAIWLTSLPGAIWLGRGVKTEALRLPGKRVNGNA